MQYVLAIGGSDITDLIGNTLGGVAGIGVFAVLHRLFGRKDHQSSERSGAHWNGCRSRVPGIAGHCKSVDSNSGLLASVGILWYSYAKEVLFHGYKRMFCIT